MDLLSNSEKVNLFISLLIIVVIVGSPIFFYFLNKILDTRLSWEGEVIDKSSGTRLRLIGYLSSFNTYYKLIIKTTDGKIKKLDVNQGIYDEFKVGDKIQKLPGETLPVKVK